MRISPPRSVDGIYEIVDESSRLSSLHTVEPISRNGRESLVDLSSAAVMARQVLEDVLSLLYLSEPNLSKE